MQQLSPRRVAVSLLVRILDHRQTLDEALAQDAGFSALEGSDRGFARAMVSAVLRWLGQLDKILARHVTGRDFYQLDPEVRHLLRVGAAQVCVLRTPIHAAVSETVETARAVDGARKAGGLINAVMRKLAPEDLETLNAPAVLVWPESFRTLMTEALGGANATALAESSLEPPPLDLTVLKDAKLWSEKLGGEQIGPTTVRLEEGVVETLTGYDTGNWWVQDVAATLPVQLLAPKKGEHILDVCAAPGGKTLQIAASGARVTALDRSSKRLRLVRENLKRTRLEAECIAADATKWTPDAPVDAVLLDAPCSALGTLRRHPESPWIKLAEDLERFPSIQARLLDAAAQMVKPGGRLVYCVCTPLPREGVEVVSAFLEANSEWSRAPMDPAGLSPFEGAVTPEGDIMTLPGTVDLARGHDVFFIATLQRD